MNVSRTIPKIVAHRGAQIEALPQAANQIPAYKVYTENTLDAFARAAELGADAIELDVIATTDGQLAVYHDDKSGRIFRLPDGDKLIKDAESREIQNAVYDPATVQATYEPKLADIPGAQITYANPAPKIPTLAEVFDRVFALKPGMHIYVELKTSNNTLPTRTNGMEEAVAALIKARNLYDKVTVIGFNPWTLLKIKTLDPKIKTGLDLVVAPYLEQMNLTGLMDWAKNILKVDSLLPPYRETTEAFVKAAKAVGLKVFPWVWHETLKEELEKAPQLAAMGVDGIITNTASLMQKNIQS